MKKKGATCEYNSARDEAMIEAYRHHARESERIRMHEIAAKVATTPCSRFFVSEERAFSVVSSMMRGVDATKGMNESKRRMYQEIHRRVVDMQRSRPRLTLSTLVGEVINSPAPELYLSSRYVYDRLTSLMNSRRKWKI